MIVHSYARFSFSRQQLGDSERRQIEASKDFCKRNKHTLSDLQLFDRGKSGFKGNKQAALQEFLKKIKTGEVKPGEILLVESVDRLSRKGIRPTQTLINTILNAGIHIAILMPVEKVYRADDSNDLGGAIELAAFAYQAHVYSEMLSGRIKSWWTANRKEAQENGKIITGITPCWLEKTEKGFVVKPQAAKVIEYIFRRTIEGIGTPTLVKELNEQFEPFMGRKNSKFFNKTFVRDLISKRTVLGEYQPHKMTDEGEREPVGDVLENYYPRLIDEKTWLAANAATKNRKVETGPTGDFVNLFVGLLHHAIDDCPIHIASTKAKRADGSRVSNRRYKSYNAVSGRPNATTHTIAVEDLERAVFSYLRELDPAKLNSKTINTDIEKNALEGDLKLKKDRIQELQAALKTNAQSVAVILPVIEELQAECKVLTDQIRKLSIVATPIKTATEVKELINSEQSPETRQRLRELLKQIIEVINIATVKLGDKRRSPVAAAIEIIFKSGHRRTIALCQKKQIAFTDYEPTEPTLAERKDLKKWLKTFEKAARTLI